MEDFILKSFHLSLKKNLSLTFQAVVMAGKCLGTIVHKETEKLVLSEYKTFITKTSQLGYTTSLPLAP